MIKRCYKSIVNESGATNFTENEYLDAYILDIPGVEIGSLSYLALEIAARARYALFKGIYNNKEKIIYCDTDSIILRGTPNNLDVDDWKLGAWKDERKDC